LKVAKWVGLSAAQTAALLAGKLAGKLAEKMASTMVDRSEFAMVEQSVAKKVAS